MKRLIPLALALISLAAQAKPSKPTAEMQAVLTEFARLNPKPIETLSPLEAREQPTPADAVKSLLEKKHRSVDDRGIAQVQDIQITGAAGAIRARVYTPVIARRALPIVVYFHGGGFVIADIETYDSSARALAKEANAIVVSVEYRKGPEYKFPSAHDDAVAAYRWVLDNADLISGDSKRVALAGESAGANLAINVAIAARDQELQKPKAVVAIYPVAGSDMKSPSYKMYANAKPLSKALMMWFMQNYLGDLSLVSDPRINLLDANLQRLPPTTIIGAEIDPLQTEGKLFAEKMRQAGDSVTYQLYRGVTHEFFGMSDVLTQARQAQAVAGKALKM